MRCVHVRRRRGSRSSIPRTSPASRVRAGASTTARCRRPPRPHDGWRLIRPAGACGDRRRILVEGRRIEAAQLRQGALLQLGVESVLVELRHRAARHLLAHLRGCILDRGRRAGTCSTGASTGADVAASACRGGADGADGAGARWGSVGAGGTGTSACTGSLATGAGGAGSAVGAGGALGVAGTVGVVGVDGAGGAGASGMGAAYVGTGAAGATGTSIGGGVLACLPRGPIARPGRMSIAGPK